MMSFAPVSGLIEAAASTRTDVLVLVFLLIILYLTIAGSIQAA
jgi:hypothetical protein